MQPQENTQYDIKIRVIIVEQSKYRVYTIISNLLYAAFNVVVYVPYHLLFCYPTTIQGARRIFTKQVIIYND